MIERKMNGSPDRRSSNQELIDKVDRELALGKECLENIAKHQGCRGNAAQMTFIDDSPFQRDQYVNETPYTKRDLYILPRSIGKTVGSEKEAFIKGRQLGKYPDPIRLIDVSSRRELRIPGEAFPEGLVDPDVEVSLKKEFEFPIESSSTIGFIRVNGVEYPIVSADSVHSGMGMNEDVLFQMAEEEFLEGSYREPILDNFSKIRPGYKGGNTPNIFKSMEPCSKVNPKDVAKRRAKNKAARKNKRK